VAGVIKFTIPVKTTNPLNGSQGRTRGAVLAKAAQRKKQRNAARLCGLAGIYNQRPELLRLPFRSAALMLTRVSAGTLDTDGLAASLKSIRDGLADCLGVADNDPRVTWSYAQRKGKRREYSVEVEIT
jgi:hypothetical protein